MSDDATYNDEVLGEQGAEWLARVARVAREDLAGHPYLKRFGEPTRTNEDYYIAGFAQCVRLFTRFMKREGADITTFLPAYIVSREGEPERWLRIIEGDEP